MYKSWQVKITNCALGEHNYYGPEELKMLFKNTQYDQVLLYRDRKFKFPDGYECNLLQILKEEDIQCLLQDKFIAVPLSVIREHYREPMEIDQHESKCLGGNYEVKDDI